MNCCDRIGLILRHVDLFGVPVQLTYQGQKKFTTCCGGVMSILMFLSLAVTLVWAFLEELLKPQFLSTPKSSKFYNYDPSVYLEEFGGIAPVTQILEISKGNTITAFAGYLNQNVDMRQDVRIRFYTLQFETDGSELTSTEIDAVWCKDFYAEQIAEDSKKIGTDSYLGFDSTFDRDGLVCPNITDIVFDGLTQLRVDMIPCRDGNPHDKYA